jgi:hypothetical protein
MTWSLAGLVLAAASAAIAWGRSRARGGFYDREIYAMSPAIHRRYAAVFAIFAIGFGTALALHLDSAGIVALALYALLAVFYVASFLRGADDD